jgi:hypothetical protein
MKKPIAFLAFTVIMKMAATQEYSFPLYFEDAVGNKDTLNFGFDQSASFGVDENLGEANIIGQPYDSTFFVFFTDAATYDELDFRLQEEKTFIYIKKVYKFP